MLTRRSFLKTTLAVGPLIISAKALGQEGPGANDVVNVGLIGLGGRCREIASNCLGIPQIRIAAVCDCFQPRVDRFIATVGKDQSWKGYTNFLEMIEKEKLDAVMVETTTHARAWVTCMAMAAGMDVYIEKPMCLNIAEGRAMVNIARKYGRVTQVGTQQRSIPLNNWACDLVKNGAIGKLKNALAPNFMGPRIWTPKPAEPMPDGGPDNWWDVWTNASELRPYHHDLHQGWSLWRDYDAGGQSFGVSGWGTHSYDQLQRGLGTDETGPTEILLEEAMRHEKSGVFDERTPSEDETGAPYYGMVRNSEGPRAKVRMKYANGVEVLLHLDADRGPGLGCAFVGEGGTIEVNRDRISANPKELVMTPDRPDTLKVPENQPHIENWIECIKSRGKCNADIEYGHRSTSLCSLVNIARDLGRVGETLNWDPVTEKFVNCPEGDAMLSRPRRAGYELPA